MEKLFGLTGKFIVRFRWMLIISILFLGIFASLGIKDLRTSVSLNHLFLDDDPVMLDQDKFDTIFGNSDFAGVLVESEDVFSPETVEVIRQLSNELVTSMDLMNSTTSIATFIDDTSPEALELSRKSLNKRQSVRGKLYSEDYKQAWILCSLKAYPPSDEAYDQHDDPAYLVGQDILRIVEKYKTPGITLIPTGVPVLLVQKSEDMIKDLIKVILLASLIAVVLIVIVMRSWLSIIGSILTIAVSIGSVFGAMGWMKMTIDTTFMLIPVLLSIAVSIGYTIHIFNFYKRNLILTGEKENSTIYAVKETGWPILFTAFTTIFALLSFVVVPITAIQWVGLVSAISITVVYLLSMLLFTAIISLGKNSKIIRGNSKNRHDSIDGIDKVERLIGKVSDVIMKNGIALTIIYVILIIISLVGITRLKVDLNREQMLGNKLPHAKNQNYVSNSKIGASNAYYIALLFPEKNNAVTSEVLRKVEELEEFIGQVDFVKRTTSINSVVKEVNMLRHRGSDDFYTIPEKDSTVRGLISYTRRMSDGSLNSWIDQENKSLKILVEIYDVSTLKTKKHIDELGVEISRLFPGGKYPEFDFLLTGSAIQMSIMNQYITTGLIQSVITALIVISIMMMIVFRNFKLGLIAMIPNITPIIITGGLMGYMGVSLEFVTMTIAPMVMGLAVDDTIHFINHVKMDYGRTGNYDRSIKNSFIKVGKALILANIILCATFSSFMTSDVNSMVNMGLFMVVAMLSALIADFTVTPYIIKLSRPFGKEMTI